MLSQWRVYRKYGSRLLHSLSYAADQLYHGPVEVRKLAGRTLAYSHLGKYADVEHRLVKLWLLRTGIAVSTKHGWLASGPNVLTWRVRDWEALGVPPPYPLDKLRKGIVDW